MKCSFCGQPLALEEEFCAHCGQMNPHAQQHIRDMKHYKGEFENTKQGVYAATGRYKAVTVRVVIIAVLVVLIAVMLFLYNNAYGMYFDVLRMDAKRNAEEYSAIMDEYIEQEDFRRFSLFCNEHEISSYEDEYEMYAPVIRSTNYYVRFCENVMEYVAESTEDGETPDWDYVAYALNEFYNASDLSQYEYMENVDSPENLQALEIMENNMQLMLQTYLGFTEAETTSLKEFSEAKRTVLFEEKFK